MKKAIQTMKALHLKGARISYNVINPIATELLFQMIVPCWLNKEDI